MQHITLQKRAFTLIEMLVVIAIIALLTGILVPSVSSATRRANMVKSMSKVKQFAQAGLLYANDNMGQIPHVRHPGTNEGWYLRLWEYLDQEGLTTGEKFDRVQFREQFLRDPAYPVPLDKQQWNRFGFGMNGLPLAGDRDNWFYGDDKPTLKIYQISNPAGRPWFGSAMEAVITFDIQGTRFFAGGPYNPVDKSNPQSAPGDIRYGKKGVYSFFDGSAKALTPEQALAGLSQYEN